MLLEKWGFLTCHQNAHFAELVSGSHRKERPFSCCTGGAAVAGCHPRPEMDGRHFNSRISLRDTHAATAAAAAERQLAGTWLCCVRHSCLCPAPSPGTFKTSTNPPDASSLTNVARRKWGLKGEVQGGVVETKFSPSTTILRASSIPPRHAQF